MLSRENNSPEDFTIDLVRDVGENYLVVSLPEQQKTVLHQLEIMNCHIPPGLIPVEERKSNNQIKLYYRLNSRVSLRYYLERAERAKGEIIKILDDIVSLLLKSKSFLFYASGFLLHQDYIYLNPTTQEVALVYLPVKLPGDVNENFRELLKRIIFSCEDFPQNLVDYSEEKFFNLKGFREQLKAIKFTDIKRGKKMKEQEKPFQLESTLTLTPEIPIVEKGKTKEDEETVVAQERLRVKVKEEEVPRVKSSHFKKMVMGVFGLVQLVIIFVLILLSPWLNSLGNTFATYSGIALLIIAFNLLLLRFFSLKYPDFKQ